MTIRPFAALSIFTLCVTCAAHADDTRNYAYAWPLTTQGDSAAWQVEPGADVYAAISEAQLGDLEVVDEAGNPVPMAPRAAESTTTASSWIELALFALPAGKDGRSDDEGVSLRIERSADGRLRSLDAGVNPGSKTTSLAEDFILDASNLDAAIDALRVDWDETADTVNMQFAVSVSDDLQNWRIVKASASVLGLTQAGNHLSRHEINLGGVRARYLRLHRLDNSTVLPILHVSARASVASTPLRAARQWLAASTQPVDADDDKALPGSAIYRYTLPAAVPVEALKIELASDNSIANVRLSSRIGTTNIWAPRANFIAFRLRQGDSVIGNDEVAAQSGSRSSEWRIEATPPLNHAPGLSVAWRPARFVFLAQGHGPYRLIAGSASARRADYPLDIALSELRSRASPGWQPPLAGLGPRDTLAGAAALKPRPVPDKPYDWKSWLLWAVLVGAAALIGYLALSLLRSPKNTERPNSGP